MIENRNKKSGSACKKICLNYAAKKPVNSGRYVAGQVRCQICEIYMTIEGTKDGRFCKCCHYRVRTKPRNKKYKEILREKSENNTSSDISVNDIKNSEIKNNSTKDDNRWLEELTKQRITQESENNKKSTPIYEETDESVKTFYELKEFLESTIKLQANYQLVMIKELLEYGKLHKGEIAESLAYFNNKDSSNLKIVSYYLDVPVYNVLLKYGIVIESEYFRKHYPYYLLNVKLTEHQKNSMLDYLIDSISKYNLEHNISENEFPDADNMGSIDWEYEYDRVENYASNNSHKSESTVDKKDIDVTEETSAESMLSKGKATFNLINKQKICIICKKNILLTTQFSDLCDECRHESNIKEKSKDKGENPLSNSYDLMTVENSTNGIELNKFKKIKSDSIKKDEIISNDQLVEKFGVGNMGDIRYTEKNNLIILLSTHSNDYDDSIDTDSGLIIYTGEGKNNQEIKNGNEKILNSQNTPIVFFKEVYQEQGVKPRGALDNKYKFVGTVKYQKHYWKEEKGQQVIKFVMEIQS